MISFKKAFRFAWQPYTFVVSFFWLVFYIFCLLGILNFIKSIILDNLMGVSQGLPKSLAYIIQIYGMVCLIGSILTEIYFLIVAKKKVFDQPVSFSLSFFVRKAMVLLPVFLGYSLLSWLTIYPARTGGTGSLILTIGGMLILFYILTTFLISYIECFNLDSVYRLFPKILRQPLLILVSWLYLIIYAVVICFLIKFLGMGTQWVLKELVPLLLPCGTILAIMTMVGGSIPITLLYRMLPRKGRFYLLASFIFIVPTVILYEVIDLPFNFLMFLVVGQVIWYWAYFGIVLGMGISAFSAHLMAQACRCISDIKPQNNP
ncbi:MAG: hypothetical protein IJV07_00985 [Alphaproteobacteria bacterium]|nr:hypothetical protein [Alphaproteobacteria bacterium]